MADPRRSVVMIGGVPVVDAPHEIDADNAECFDKLLLHAASCGRRTVVVNMTGTPVLRLRRVRVLARAYERALAAGGELLMVIPASAFVLSVFALTGLDRLIPIFAGLNEALEQAHAVIPRPLRRRDEPSAEAGVPDV